MNQMAYLCDAVNQRGYRSLWRLVWMAVILSWYIGNATTPCMAETGDASEDQLIRTTAGMPFPGENAPFSDISFPTFNKTGLEACTNADGRPLIFLFSTSSCARCEWVKDVFDFIARYYAAQGLIEAYHYDVSSGDNLLTEAVETEVPPEHLQIKEHGDPKGYVPYFNFGCKYERLGNGYEEENDLASEGAEMREIIETLVRIHSKDDSE